MSSFLSACLSHERGPPLAQRIPEYIRLRILRQFAVTVAQAIDVIALLGGRNLQVYRIERKRS